MILSNHNKLASGNLNKQEFTFFARVYLNKLTDLEASELFNFLVGKKRDVSDNASDRENLPAINK